MSDIRKDLYGNVVLSGGTTMFAGIGERMKELIPLVCVMFTCVVLGKYLALHHSNMLNYRNLLSQMLSVVSNVQLQMLSDVSRMLSS